MAKIEREKIERDRFQRTGIIPAFEIISKLPDFTMIAKFYNHCKSSCELFAVILKFKMPFWV
jgi:hypothetical protein